MEGDGIVCKEKHRNRVTILCLQSHSGSHGVFTENCCRIHGEIECYFQVTVVHRGSACLNPDSIFYAFKCLHCYGMFLFCFAEFMEYSFRL